MKKILRILLLMIMIVFTSGCGTIAGSNGANDNEASSEPSNEPTAIQEEEYTFQAEIIETGSSLLVTPDSNSNEYKSSDKISVHLTDTILRNTNKEEITMDQLQVGDYVNITYNGNIAESYPAQIWASAVEITGHNIIIDGYLTMIDQIWQEDDGLNSDIDMIALDTTGWIELNDFEKEIVFTKLKTVYGYEIIEGTFDELRAQGLIDKEILSFEKGILITINDMTYNNKKKEITYSIQKWRGGDGAIGMDKATATFNGSNWVLTNGAFWIS